MRRPSFTGIVAIGLGFTLLIGLALIAVLSALFPLS
jgi:hypothetical protein